MNLPQPHQRLQLANRIHLFLLRELGQGIDIARMLRGGSYTDDVLTSCEACHGTGLVELAQRFRAASRAARRDAAPAAESKQDLDWAADNSDFGNSALPPAFIAARKPVLGPLARLGSR